MTFVGDDARVYLKNGVCPSCGAQLGGRRKLTTRQKKLMYDEKGNVNQGWWRLWIGDRIPPKEEKLREVCAPHLIYYFLENYNLDEVEIESDLMVDGRREITFKRVGTDEGGNDVEEEE